MNMRHEFGHKAWWEQFPALGKAQSAVLSLGLAITNLCYQEDSASARECPLRTAGRTLRQSAATGPPEESTAKRRASEPQASSKAYGRVQH